MWIELGDSMYNAEGLRSAHKVTGKDSTGKATFGIALMYAEASPGNATYFDSENARDHAYNVLVKTLKCTGSAFAKTLQETRTPDAGESKPALQILRIGAIDFRMNDIMEIVAEGNLPSISLWASYTSGHFGTHSGTEHVWDASNGARPTHIVHYDDVELMTQNITRIRDSLKMMGFVETPGIYPKRWSRP